MTTRLDADSFLSHGRQGLNSPLELRLDAAILDGADEDADVEAKHVQ